GARVPDRGEHAALSLDERRPRVRHAHPGHAPGIRLQRDSADGGVENGAAETGGEGVRGGSELLRDGLTPLIPLGSSPPVPLSAMRRGGTMGEDQSARNRPPPQCRTTLPAPRRAATRAGGHAPAAPAGTRAAGPP